MMSRREGWAAGRKGAAMGGVDRTQLFTVLMLVVMALFVSSGIRYAGRWRRPLQIGAITLFAVALGFALIEVAIWLSAGAL